MQERDPSWQSSYKLLPSGVCHRVVSVDEKLNVAHWANMTGSFADKWTHPSDSFDTKSWERVANDEMWHAKYDSAIVRNFKCNATICDSTTVSGKSALGTNQQGLGSSLYALVASVNFGHTKW